MFRLSSATGEEEEEVLRTVRSLKMCFALAVAVIVIFVVFFYYYCCCCCYFCYCC